MYPESLLLSLPAAASDAGSRTTVLRNMGPKDLCKGLDIRSLAGSFPALTKQLPQQTREQTRHEPRCRVAAAGGGELHGQLRCGPGASRWQCSARNRAPGRSGALPRGKAQGRPPQPSPTGSQRVGQARNLGNTHVCN